MLLEDLLYTSDVVANIVIDEIYTKFGIEKF